jgi:hypothetical protein
MGTGQIVTLSLMGVVFVLWAAHMFVYLFRLRRDATERMQRDGAGPFARFAYTLATFRDFAVAPRYRRDRNRLALLTVLMFASIGAHAFFLSPQTGG